MTAERSPECLLSPLVLSRFTVQAAFKRIKPTNQISHNQVPVLLLGFAPLLPHCPGQLPLNPSAIL